MSGCLKASGILSLVFLTSVLLAGCPAPGGGGTSHTLSGKVLCSDSGQPVAGATVGFANYPAVITAGDGSFSIDLGTGTGTVTGDFYVYGGGTKFNYLSGCTCEKGVDTNLTLYNEHLGSSTTHTITGRIYERQTNPAVDTEIATGSNFTFCVFNTNGGRGGSGGSRYTYDQTSGYSIDTPAFGSDCLVAAWVTAFGQSPFSVVVKADLSASSTQIDLYQDLAHTTTVTMNGDAVGNSGFVSLVSPYGTFTVASVEFTSSPSASTSVTNPYGYPGVWTQEKKIEDYPSAGYSKYSFRVSSIASIGTSVTLPTIDTSLGPGGAGDPATLSYVNGTLSVAPVTGATLYVFRLQDNSSAYNLGDIGSSSASVSLPPWMRSLLATKSIRVSVDALAISAALDMQLIKALLSNSAGSVPTTPGVQWGSVSPPSGNNWKDLTF